MLTIKESHQTKLQAKLVPSKYYIIYKKKKHKLQKVLATTLITKESNNSLYCLWTCHVLKKNLLTFPTPCNS
jgi:hypothetical protein